MPKTGLGRDTKPATTSDVRARLVEAGEAVLLESGFLGASARAIAQRAGVATGSVHYHFDSVEDLLLASLERATSARLEEYRALRDEAPGLGALLERLTGEFGADREAGRFRLLAQLMAGAATGGPLAAAVAERAGPWLDLTEETIEQLVGARPFGLIDAKDIAMIAVALFIGLELLGHVDPDRFDTTGLIERFGGVVQLLAGALGGGATDGR